MLRDALAHVVRRARRHPDVECHLDAARRVAPLGGAVVPQGKVAEAVVQVAEYRLGAVRQGLVAYGLEGEFG